MKKELLVQRFVEQRDALETLIHERFHDLAQSKGLTLEQYHLLLELESLTEGTAEKSDAPTIGHMARSVNLSQNTMSEKITRLEKKNLVQRKKDEQDRRISRVSLTSEGKALLQEIEKNATSIYLEDALRTLPESELETLTTLMDHLLSTMKVTIKGTPKSNM